MLIQYQLSDGAAPGFGQLARRLSKRRRQDDRHHVYRRSIDPLAGRPCSCLKLLLDGAAPGFRELAHRLSDGERPDERSSRPRLKRFSSDGAAPGLRELARRLSDGEWPDHRAADAPRAQQRKQHVDQVAHLLALAFYNRFIQLV